MNIAAVLRKYQGGLTQDEYAARLGIAQGTLSLIYSGKRRIGLDVLRALAQTFPESANEIAAVLVAQEPAALPLVPEQVA